MKTITFLGRALMLRLTMLLFVAFAPTIGAAQNACAISGVGPAENNVFPIPVISTCYDNAGLTYQSNPLDPTSTFAWSISNAIGFENTSGAFIIGPTTGNTVQVNSGPNAGSFFLVCIVTGDQGSQACGVSVAVYKPAVTANPKNVCAGSTVALTGTPEGGVWSGDHVTGSTFDATGLAAGPYTVTYTFTDIHGCTNFDEATVTVDPEPTATATNSGPVCYGVTSINLNESGGDAVSWLWSSNGSATITNTTDQSPTVTGFVNGEIFTVMITDENGCTSIDTTTVTVYPEPICSASNNGPICDGDDVILSETGGDAVSWLWSSNGAATFNDATLQNPTASGAVNGEIFTVVITDINGCTSTCTTTVIVEPCADEGCTLGYWKNHTDRWCEAYRTCDLFGDVFVNAPSTLANLSLLEALNLGGGGINNLARQAVAALLNACSGEVDYAGYSDDPALIIDAVNAAFRAGGKEPGMLASQLDLLNNSGCPLGGTKATSATNCTNGDSKVAVPEEPVAIDSSVDFKVYPVPYADIINVSYRFEYDTDVTIQVFNLQGRLIHGAVDNLYNNREVAVKQISLPRNIDQALVVRLTTNKEKLNKTIVAKSSTQR